MRNNTDNLAAADTRSHGVAFPPSRYISPEVDARLSRLHPLVSFVGCPTSHRFNGDPCRDPTSRACVRACLRACVRACVHAPIHRRARGVATTRVPAASSISRIRRDLICRAAATTPAKRIFDLVRGEVQEREGEREGERTVEERGREAGRTVEEGVRFPSESWLRSTRATRS